MIPTMPPIRPRTATRLGLRTPYSRPGSILRFPRPLTDDEFVALRDQFRGARGGNWFRTTLLDSGCEVEITASRRRPSGSA